MPEKFEKRKFGFNFRSLREWPGRPAIWVGTSRDLGAHLLGLLLSVPWLPRPRNRAAAATCGRGRCDFRVTLRLTPKIAIG